MCFHLILTEKILWRIFKRSNRSEIWIMNRYCLVGQYWRGKLLFSQAFVTTAITAVTKRVSMEAIFIWFRARMFLLTSSSAAQMAKYMSRKKKVWLNLFPKISFSHLKGEANKKNYWSFLLPFFALAPHDINFSHLNEAKSFNGEALISQQVTVERDFSSFSSFSPPFVRHCRNIQTIP